MYLVISCEDHSIEIIEKQECSCKILFEGSYLECSKYKEELIEEYGYTGSIWNNKKQVV